MNLSYNNDFIPIYNIFNVNNSSVRGNVGINNYYPDEHTDYSRGISNNRHFNLLTFTWSREDEV